ncbi:MAG: heparinase II/III family protein [Planctomycetes bacterium]|nr:heparinase II/III family protein [Planctomycetota bacterium]
MSPQLHSGHPRLHLAPGQLPAYRKLSLGPRRAYREKLLQQLEPCLKSVAALRANTGRGYDHLALALGQAWRLTGDARYGRAARWLLESLEFCAHERPTGYDTWGVVAECAAYLYDWLHDYWKREGLLEVAARAALHCAREAFEHATQLYIVDDWHNYSLGLQSGALAGALAVGREFPKLEDGSLLRKMHALHFTGLVSDELFLQDAYRLPRHTRCLQAALRGGNGAGFAAHLEATGAYHTVDGYELIKMASLWTHAQRGGKLVWPEVQAVGRAVLSFMRPDQTNLNIGDSRPNPLANDPRIANILLHIQARTPDPAFAAYLRAEGHRAEQPFPNHLLLRAQRGAEPSAAERERFDRRALAAWPLASKIDPIVTLRSGWGANDTFVAFRCGRHGGWHNHLDHNAFTIFRGGALAIDSGGIHYGSPHRPEYSMRTLAHNAILVRDPDEGDWIGKLGQPTANDGGQRLVVNAYAPPNDFTGKPHAVMSEDRRKRFRDEFDMGEYLAFEPGARFDYVAGDATRAYTYPWSGLGDNHCRRVEEAVRQLVFLKPDLIVVFDRVEATRARFEKTWLLHTMEAPVALVRGKRRKAARGIRPLPASGPFEAEHARGRLTVWPLLPAARKARTIGGKGFECWVEHAAGGGSKNFPAPAHQSETGAWRIEIAPRKPSARDCFLTVLHAGLKRETPARERFRCAARTDGAYAAVTIESLTRGTWREYAVVRFRTAGPVEVDVVCRGERAKHAAPAPRRVPQARASKRR